jgi:hypothetical protein
MSVRGIFQRRRDRETEPAAGDYRQAPALKAAELRAKKWPCCLSGAQGLLGSIPFCRSGSTGFRFGCPAASRCDPTCGLYDVRMKRPTEFAERSGTSADRGSAFSAEPHQTVRWCHAPLPVCCSNACSDRRPRACLLAAMCLAGDRKDSRDSGLMGRARQPLTGLLRKNVIGENSTCPRPAAVVRLVATQAARSRARREA